jgi:hypothetical protein
MRFGLLPANDFLMSKSKVDILSQDDAFAHSPYESHHHHTAFSTMNNVLYAWEDASDEVQRDNWTLVPDSLIQALFKADSGNRPSSSHPLSIKFPYWSMNSHCWHEYYQVKNWSIEIYYNPVNSIKKDGMWGEGVKRWYLWWYQLDDWLANETSGAES